MPLIQVKLIAGVFDAAEKEAIIEKLTDAMVSVEGEAMRPVTWVTIDEVAAVSGASPARPCTPATSSACAPLRSSRAHHGTVQPISVHIADQRGNVDSPSALPRNKRAWRSSPASSTQPLLAPPSARSPGQWHPGADAELVALRIGHGNERGVSRLAHVDPGGTESLQFRCFGLDVVDANVEVHPGLCRLRFRHSLHQNRRIGRILGQSSPY